MRVSIIIATYGSEDWRYLALKRAFPSAKDQGAYEIIVGHDDMESLSHVRNTLAQKATGDWLCFLDGDDELAPNYLGAMERAFEQERGHSSLDGLLLTPAVSFVRSSHKPKARFQREQDLRDGNWLTIGTLISTGTFIDSRGFRDWPLYEDWDLWARSATRIVKVSGAIYYAHYSPTSRNRRAHRAERNYWHQMIGHDLWPDYYDTPTQQEHASREVAGVRKLIAA